MGKYPKLLSTVLFMLLALSGCGRERGHRVVSTDGVAVSYDVQGEGEPALVFVHGWSCDRSYWKFQTPYFAERYKVVTIDLAGHGESGLGREKWTMEAFGQDVMAVVEELDLDKVILIGHSMGGPVILEAARQMNERVIGVVGVDTFLNIEVEHPQEQIDNHLGRFRADFAASTERLVRNILLPDADPALVEWIIKDMSAGPPEVEIGAMEAYLNYDRKKAFGAVRAPIHCINSDMRAVNVEAAQKYARSYKVKFMSGVGHFVMMENPEKFNMLLTEVVKLISEKDS